MGNDDPAFNSRDRSGSGAVHPPFDTAYPATSPGHAVVASFVELAEQVGRSAPEPLASLCEMRDHLRAHLRDEGCIHQIPGPKSADYTIAAVDGASAVQSRYATDIMAATAVAAGGMFNAGPQNSKVLTWADARAHSRENSSLVQLHMFARELALLEQLTHEYRIIDGNHMNPLIEMARALTGSGALHGALIGLLSEFDIPSAIQLLAKPESGVFSLTKADTQRRWSNRLRTVQGFSDLPDVTDKVLTAVILNEGEMLSPIPASDNAGAIRRSIEPGRGAPQQFKEALGLFLQTVAEERLQVTYFKPATLIGALKLQFTASTSRQKGHLAEAGQLAAVTARECFGPAMQEPLPQYLADQAAKKVSVGLRLIEQQVMTNLPTHTHQFASLLAFEHRS